MKESIVTIKQQLNGESILQSHPAKKLNSFYRQQLSGKSNVECKEINNLFRSVFNFNANTNHLLMFMEKINTLVESIDCTNYETPKRSDDIKQQREEGQNKIKGDLFEIFTFIYLRTFGGAFGIFSVDILERDTIGKDFKAVNKYNTPCNIQAKYVQSANATLGADADGKRSGSLETFFASPIEGTVVSADRVSSILVTTARKVHPYYVQIAREDGKRFQIHDYDKLKRFVNNNGFWADVAKKTSSIFPE